jgi:hypothetical protein
MEIETAKHPLPGSPRSATSLILTSARGLLCRLLIMKNNSKLFINSTITVSEGEEPNEPWFEFSKVVVRFSSKLANSAVRFGSNFAENAWFGSVLI